MPNKYKNNIIGITMGDPSGIGPEIIAKALSSKKINRFSKFLIIGDYTIYSKYSKSLPKGCSFLDVKTPSINKIKIGKINKISGNASYAYLLKSVDLIKNKKISSIVTAPVSKEAIILENKKFRGHTEFLAEYFNIKKVGMMFVSDNLKMILVTRHIPLNKVSKTININSIFDTIIISYKGLKNLFKIKNPKIAICGLNPHAGEGGNIGSEEIDIIIPAIKKAKKKNINVKGPFPADTLFTPDVSKNYDLIISMYHDQGLVALKTVAFKSLINLTVGLPFIRTSPAHGTAFDIAGKNKADPSSLCESIKLVDKLNKQLY